MTNAEMFAAFQAFMAAQNAQTDVVADVAADVVKTGPDTTVKATTTNETALTIVRGTIKTPGRYGVQLEETGDDWYSVGRGFRESVGEIFKGIPKGTAIEISMKGKRAKSVRIVGDAPKDAPVVLVKDEPKDEPKVSAPKLTPEQTEIAALKAKLAALEAPKDEPKVAAPIHPTVKTGTCPFCGRVPDKKDAAPHGNEWSGRMVCALTQWGALTGRKLDFGPDMAPVWIEFWTWVDATRPVVWYTNAQRWTVFTGERSGASAPDPISDKAFKATIDAAVKAEKTVSKDAPKATRETHWHECPAQDGKKRLATVSGTCKRCEGMAPETTVATQETVETAGSVSVDVAAAEGIVPTPRTAPTDGTFKCYVDKFKTGAQSNPAQPIVRLFNGAELMNDVGVGFTVRCASAEILSKLAKYPTATWFTVTFKAGLVVKVTRVLNEKTGFKAPVQDTAGIKTSGKNDAPIPATPRKDDTPAERRAAMRKTAGKNKATGLVSVTSEHCPKCSRRFSMVGRNATSIVCKACEAA